MGTRRGLASWTHDAQSEARGITNCFLANRNVVPHSIAIGDARRAAAGHHHARQRVCESKCRLLFPRGGRESGAFSGTELFVRYFAARADNASKSGRTI